MRYLAFTNHGIYESDRPKIVMTQYQNIEEDFLEYWERESEETTTTGLKTFQIKCNIPIPNTDIRIGFASDFDPERLNQNDYTAP